MMSFSKWNDVNIFYFHPHQQFSRQVLGTNKDVYYYYIIGLLEMTSVRSTSWAMSSFFCAPQAFQFKKYEKKLPALVSIAICIALALTLSKSKISYSRSLKTAATTVSPVVDHYN